MIEYVVIIILLMFLYPMMKKLKKGKFYYCVLAGGLIYILIALKNPFLGNSDTLSIYYPAFKHVISNDMTFVFYRYLEESVIFYPVTKIISMFTTNVVVYYAILEIPIIFAISKLIYKYSKKPWLSFIIFFMLQYYTFCFIALKHAVAIGFLVLALDALLEKKYKKFFVLTIIATLFHATAIVFLFAYFVQKLKITRWKIVITFILAMIIILLKDNIFSLIFSIFDSGRYSMYENRRETINLLTFGINLTMFVFAYVFLRKVDSEENNKEIVLLNLLWTGTIVSILTVVLAEFLRISMYFSISCVILIPNVLKQIEYKQRNLYTFVLIVILLIYFFGSNLPNLNLLPYQFYWETNLLY